MFEELLQDLGFARRAMARRPGTTLLAVLILALGIGASVSMFSVVDAAILRPLPYPDAERLMSIYTTIPDWLENESLAGGWNRTKTKLIFLLIAKRFLFIWIIRPRSRSTRFVSSFSTKTPEMTNRSIKEAAKVVMLSHC